MSQPHPAIDLAVIGGTGVYALAELADVRTELPGTPYGAPSGPLRIGALGGRRVAFLARHGERHSVPPHRINYRANLAALQQAGATRVLALNTVGGIAPAYAPRVLGCPDQLIDYTWGRISTLCEGDAEDGRGGAVLHVDFGEPYTPSLRAQLLAAAAHAGVAVVDGGCYGATQGPRLETRAEIARLRRDGCDLVGMTGMPEAGLARELGLDYACLAIVANWAAGAGPDPDATITFDEVLGNVAAASAGVSRIIAALLAG
ncbi:S-methyl-5'-thioinosine phosphorylase [Cognatiluteimonas weifangensis]|uniref:Probable 6-oxopurine nucleoside phosphorylase n=1 Tax=Cognatiluteimonas weifangensis TaxID=2303539 RepID=A0A372DMC7_9GAMM|nr:S-methyl-5'-thioinosine phosphorylase [Luteimonas weifangensis]RFP60731.1 S-methyl-5'-thioinosine phosphorylase [Luteimonas weifangensis]